MLHAVIQSGDQAVHFYGEVNGYNLQTLRQFVRSADADRQGVRLLLKIDSDDRSTFDFYSHRWLQRLHGSKTSVDVHVRQDPNG